MSGKLRCPVCNSGFVYVRISSGEIVCRSCGSITKIEGFECSGTRKR